MKSKLADSLEKKNINPPKRKVDLTKINYGFNLPRSNGGGRIMIP